MKSHLQNDAEQIFDFLQFDGCFSCLCDTLIGCLANPWSTCQLIHYVNAINMLILIQYRNKYKYIIILLGE